MKSGLTFEAAIPKWINDVTEVLRNLPAPTMTFEASEALVKLRDELNKSIKDHKPK